MIVNRNSYYYFRLFCDLLLLNIAFISAGILAQSFDILIDRNRMFILEAALNFAWYFYARIATYYDDFSSRLFVFQLVNIIKIIIAQVLISIIFIFVVKEDLFTRNFLIYYSLFLFILVTLRSILFRKIMKRLRKKGVNIRNLLIIGSGNVAQNFKNLVLRNPEIGNKFIGFINNEEDEDVLGGINDLENIIQKNKIEEVVIALSSGSSMLLDEIINTCNRNAVKVHIIPDYFRYMSKKFQIGTLGDFPVITVRDEPLDEVQWRIVKRIADILFSFVVIVFLLSWLIPILSLLIRLESKGPALFIQERIGVRNKRFKCYKFRTMFTDNNQSDVFKPVGENDSRITPIGAFLRKTNIDELPQFLNVFFGSMSVVGPRPHTVPYDARYSQVVEIIKMRHNVKPGITGWAQVHGLRGDAIDEEENISKIRKRIEYDLWYIENWSVWLDVQIILLTVWQIIMGKSRGL